MTDIGIGPIIDVVEVEVLGRYFVELGFEDGTVKVLDLEPYLWGEVFEPLLNDYELFTQVQVDPQAGTTTWPNGADISPRRLLPGGPPEGPSGLTAGIGALPVQVHDERRLLAAVIAHRSSASEVSPLTPTAPRRVPSWSRISTPPGATPRDHQPGPATCRRPAPAATARW